MNVTCIVKRRKFIQIVCPSRDILYEGESISNQSNLFQIVCPSRDILYEGASISNQSNLFPVEIHLFFFGVIAL